MFCKSCGKQIESTSLFCANCGKEVRNISAKGRTNQPSNISSKLPKVNVPHTNRNSVKGRSVKSIILLLAVLMVLLICTGIYWFFLKDSHKKDATITAAAFCLCSEKYSKNLDSVYQVFIDSFPSYSFPSRHEATDKLKRLTNPSELIYEKCKSEATLNYTKFKARYIMDPDKLRLFEQEFEQQQLKCAYTEELPESPLLVEIDKIIRSIGYPPSDSTYINHAFDEGSQPTEGTGYVKTKEGSDLRLRREPSENADIITGIPNGSALIILDSSKDLAIVNGESGKWLKIKYNGQVGWAWGNFIMQEKN